MLGENSVPLIAPKYRKLKMLQRVMASRKRIPASGFCFFLGVGAIAGMDGVWVAARLGALIRMAAEVKNSLSHGFGELLRVFNDFPEVGSVGDSGNTSLREYFDRSNFGDLLSGE